MLKRILALSLAVLMTACLFAGCKQDEVGEPTEPPVVDTTEPSEKPDDPVETDPTKPNDTEDPGVVTPPPGEELEDHGDFFIMSGNFTTPFAFKDENVTITFNDIEKDDVGVWIVFDIEDSLNRTFIFSFPTGAYVNGCLVWPDVYFDETEQQNRLVIAGSDLGIYGIRDIRTFVANDVEMLDASTGEICKVVNLNAKTDSKVDDEPKEGTQLMSVKGVEVIQYYTQYGFAVEEPLFVIKNTTSDTYAVRMTRLVIDGETKSFDSSIAQQAAEKNVSAILPFKAMIQYGLGIGLDGVKEVVCDFDIYNVSTGITVKSVKDITITL